MSAPVFDAAFNANLGLPKALQLDKWLSLLRSEPMGGYYTLPIPQIYAKIAVQLREGLPISSPRSEADYLNIPKNYTWGDMYNVITGTSNGRYDWIETLALAHIVAGLRGDTGNPQLLYQYIGLPIAYKLALCIESAQLDPEAAAYIDLAEISDASTKREINKFVVGVKGLVGWSQFACWPLRLKQNKLHNTNELYGLGGASDLSKATINGSFSFDLDGVNLTSSGSEVRTTTPVRTTQNTASMGFGKAASLSSVNGWYVDLWGQPSGSDRYCIGRIENGGLQYLTAPSTTTTSARTMNPDKFQSVGLMYNPTLTGFYCGLADVNTTSQPNTNAFTDVDLRFGDNFIGTMPIGMVVKQAKTLAPLPSDLLTSLHSLYVTTLGAGLDIHTEV